MKKKSDIRPVALVTGSGRRLGRQIAYALAKRGFNIVVHYHSSGRGAREAIRYIESLGCSAFGVRADISKEQQVRGMVDRVVRHFGKIDLLVNSAGIFVDSSLANTSESVWERTLGINLKGTFLCSRFVSRFMLKRKSGKIINIASLGGLQAWHKHLPYSVSKAGVVMLTRCMAKELAPYVAVNAIAPGTIIIPSEEKPDVEHVPVDRIPLRRYGQPGDITDLVCYLALTAGYITGQTIVVDGGRAIWAGS